MSLNTRVVKISYLLLLVLAINGLENKQTKLEVEAGSWREGLCRLVEVGLNYLSAYLVMNEC